MGELRVLVLNAGSSTLKAAIIEPPERVLAHTKLAWGEAADRDDSETALATVLDELGIGGPGSASGRVDAVGYRVVHGGPRFTEPVRIDDAVLEAIEEAADLAPGHNQVALEVIAAGQALLPDVPHIACFDTAFHASLAPEAFRYPVPDRWYSQWGVRRFGFHGLSIAWSVRRSAALLGREPGDLCLAVAHLGGGCSITAVQAGRSIDTSMGMSTLEGPMMGTRSGSIDPGVPFYLAGRGLLGFGAIRHELDRESGLVGVSGSSSDMRQLGQAAEGGDERAALAIAMFVRRAAGWIATMATALPRLDALTFTGGIGEGAADVRRRIVARLGVLGIDGLPADVQPTGQDQRLDDGRGPTAVLCVESREDLVIADHVGAVMAGGPAAPGD